MLCVCVIYVDVCSMLCVYTCVLHVLCLYVLYVIICYASCVLCFLNSYVLCYICYVLSVSRPVSPDTSPHRRSPPARSRPVPALGRAEVAAPPGGSAERRPQVRAGAGRGELPGPPLSLWLRRGAGTRREGRGQRRSSAGAAGTGQQEREAPAAAGSSVRGMGLCPHGSGQVIPPDKIYYYYCYYYLTERDPVRVQIPSFLRTQGYMRTKHIGIKPCCKDRSGFRGCTCADEE